MSIRTFLFKTAGKKVLTLKNAILKPVRERCNLAIDLMGKRNPADFASKEELTEHLSKLLKEQAEMGNVIHLPVFKSKMLKNAKKVNIGLFQAKYAEQLDSDINKTAY